MVPSDSGTIVVHVAVLIAAAVYILAVLLFPDLVFAAIAKATDAVGSKIAQIGAGYGALFVDLHALPKRKATMHVKIIGVFRRWWVRVHNAFDGVVGRQPSRIRDLVQPADNNAAPNAEV